MPRITDTKTRIFNAAIDNFAKQGYNQTTMQQIASCVDIKAPSIYKHYTGKDVILNEIFEYYMIHFNRYRTPIDHILDVVEEGPASKAIPLLFYTFGSEEDTLMKIARIILDLRFENPKANELFRKLFFDEPTEYLHNVFSRLISEGKINSFDYQTFTFQMVSFSYAKITLVLTSTKSKKEIDQLHESSVTFFIKSFEAMIG